MTEAVFLADPTRLLIAAAAGIILLLLLIIKFKFHPVLSLLISALVIGLGAGMPVPTLVSTVEKGAGETLQGIVLLIGLGSLFGGILEVSGGAQCVAQTLVNKFGEKKAGIALPDGTPYLEMRCVGFPNFGIWSASADAPFVCLEPWMGRCDDCGFTGDLSEKPFINHLKMDEMFETAYTIEVF